MCIYTCNTFNTFYLMVRIDIDAVLKESIRLFPPAPAFSLKPHEDTVIGGKYKISTTDNFTILPSVLHKDPTVWVDPDTFSPERMLPENFAKLPAHAWKPFGNGARSCIGRPFAMQV